LFSLQDLLSSTTFLYRFPHTRTNPTLPGNLIPPAIWTTIEPAVQISTACLPALRVLYRKYMDNRREKAKYAAHDRLRALELTSPADGTSEGGNATTTTSDSLCRSTTQGSWTTKDHSQREGVVERDVYV